MAKAVKLPSGNYRVLVYSHTEKVVQADGSIKRERKYESFTHEDKKEAEFLAAEFAVNKKQKKRPRNITLGEAIDEYIKSSDAVLSPTTIAGYRKIRRSNFASLMDMKLKDITNDMLKEAVNIEAKRISQRHAKQKKVVSSKTVKNAYGLIVTALGMYHPNLRTKVRLPADENKIKEILPVSTIIKIVKDTDIELAALLAMWLSFSSSEIRGLTKSKSISGDYITIREVIVDVDGSPVKKSKGKEFYRNRRHKLPTRIKELIAKTDPANDYLVTTNGRYLHDAFARLLRDNNLPHMTFHDLRHVNASVMAMLRVPDKYAMERGGWKTDEVMKKVYQHTFSEERVAVDALVDRYFEETIQHEMQHDKK